MLNHKLMGDPGRCCRQNNVADVGNLKWPFTPKQKTLMEHTGDLIMDLIIPDDELEVTGTETTYEMNLAIFKIKRTVKKGK